MSTKRLPLCFLAVMMFFATSSAWAQTSTFTYQGRLDEAGSAATGTNYGMNFSLHAAPTDGTALAIQAVTNVTVSNGLFTVSLDFGNVFDGSPRWLEISVQRDGGPFTILMPRQQIAAAPYAMFANTASNLTGAIPASQLVGTIPDSALPANPVFSGIITAAGFAGGGAGLTNLSGYAPLTTNLIPSGARFDGQDPSFSLPAYGPISLEVGKTYLFVAGDTNDLLIDSGGQFFYGDASIGFNNMFTASGSNWYVANISGLIVSNQLVPSELYPFSPGTNSQVGNFVGLANLGGIFNGAFSGTFNGTLNGTVTGLGQQIGSLIKTIPITNGYLPVQESMVTRMMPKPPLWFDNFVGLNGLGVFPTTAQDITNMVDAMYTNGLVAAGWDTLAIDATWELTNYVRASPFQPLLPNTNAMSVEAFTSAIDYAHSRGIGINLYTYGSHQACGYPSLTIEGSPPGFIFNDIQTLCWNYHCDGINMDVCGISPSALNNSQLLRSISLETVNGAMNAIFPWSNNGKPYQPRNGVFPIRISTLYPGSIPPWLTEESNIIFDGTANYLDNGATLWSLMPDIDLWLARSWATRPGHFYSMCNLVGYSTRTSVTNHFNYMFTTMAVLPMPMLGVPGMINSASLPFLTNREVLDIYQDSAVLTATSLSNNADFRIIGRPLGSPDGPRKVVAFYNTNQTHSVEVTLNAAAIGITTPFSVRDPWNHVDLGTFSGNFSQTVPTNSARLFVLSAQPYSLQNTLTITGGVVTNNGIVWLATNGTPTFDLPNGSIATITDGRFFVRSNGAWVLH